MLDPDALMEAVIVGDIEKDDPRVIDMCKQDGEWARELHVAILTSQRLDAAATVDEDLWQEAQQSTTAEDQALVTASFHRAMPVSSPGENRPGASPRLLATAWPRLIAAALLIGVSIALSSQFGPGPGDEIDGYLSQDGLAIDRVGSTHHAGQAFTWSLTQPFDGARYRVALYAVDGGEPTELLAGPEDVAEERWLLPQSAELPGTFVLEVYLIDASGLMTPTSASAIFHSE